MNARVCQSLEMKSGTQSQLESVEENELKYWQNELNEEITVICIKPIGKRFMIKVQASLKNSIFKKKS